MQNLEQLEAENAAVSKKIDEHIATLSGEDRRKWEVFRDVRNTLSSNGICFTIFADLPGCKEAGNLCQANNQYQLIHGSKPNWTSENITETVDYRARFNLSVFNEIFYLPPFKKVLEETGSIGEALESVYNLSYFYVYPKKHED